MNMGSLYFVFRSVLKYLQRLFFLKNMVEINYKMNQEKIENENKKHV